MFWSSSIGSTNSSPGAKTPVEPSIPEGKPLPIPHGCPHSMSHGAICADDRHSVVRDFSQYKTCSCRNCALSIHQQQSPPRRTRGSIPSTETRFLVHRSSLSRDKSRRHTTLIRHPFSSPSLSSSSNDPNSLIICSRASQIRIIDVTTFHLPIFLIHTIWTLDILVFVC